MLPPASKWQDCDGVEKEIGDWEAREWQPAHVRDPSDRLPGSIRIAVVVGEGPASKAPAGVVGRCCLDTACTT